MVLESLDLEGAKLSEEQYEAELLELQARLHEYGRRVYEEKKTVVLLFEGSDAAGKGGAINGPGPVIVGGMLFTNSGYSYLGMGLGGNVLLAYGLP